MAHNLKGIDALYHFNLPSGSVTYSINETLYNKAMYFINQVADLSGDVEEQLLEMCRKFH